MPELLSCRGVWARVNVGIECGAVELRGAGVRVGAEMACRAAELQ